MKRQLPNGEVEDGGNHLSSGENWEWSSGRTAGPDGNLCNAQGHEIKHSGLRVHKENSPFLMKDLGMFQILVIL